MPTSDLPTSRHYNNNPSSEMPTYYIFKCECPAALVCDWVVVRNCFQSTRLLKNDKKNLSCLLSACHYCDNRTSWLLLQGMPHKTMYFKSFV